MKWLKYGIGALLALFLIGCNSSLSTETVTDPAQLQFSITINQRIGYDGGLHQQMEAFLRDKAGKTVANPAVQVRVNGVPFRLNLGSSNYYGVYPHYTLTDSVLWAETVSEYQFTIKLADGNEYPAGQIRRPAIVSSAQLSPPVSHSRTEPLKLPWQNLPADNVLTGLWKRWRGESLITDLKVSKINETKNKWGYTETADGSGDEADYITVPITSAEGSFTVPVTYFRGPQEQFTALSLLLTTTETVKADSRFLAGSTISSTSDALYRIEMLN